MTIIAEFFGGPLDGQMRELPWYYEDIPYRVIIPDIEISRSLDIEDDKTWVAEYVIETRNGNYARMKCLTSTQ